MFFRHSGYFEKSVSRVQAWVAGIGIMLLTVAVWETGSNRPAMKINAMTRISNPATMNIHFIYYDFKDFDYSRPCPGFLPSFPFPRHRPGGRVHRARSSFLFQKDGVIMRQRAPDRERNVSFLFWPLAGIGSGLFFSHPFCP